MTSALLRSRVYGFLRRVFTHEVDVPFLDWCRDQGRLGLWSELKLDLDEVLEAGDPEAAVEDLAVDFCRLFITSGAGGSPHESLHVNASREGATSLLFGDPASATKRLYREAGFGLEEEAHQLPDALSVELEFMETLSQQEADAEGQGQSQEVRRLQQLQRRMLTEHLGLWVPDYARKRSGEAGTAFYRTMLDLAADFVEWDVREHRGRGGPR